MGEKLRNGLTTVIDDEIRELKPEEYSLWDTLVEQSPQGTIFQSSSWLLLVSKYFNNDIKIIGFFHGNDLIGGCSLFIYKKLMGFLRYTRSTCELTQYGGIVIKGKKTKNTKEYEQRSILIIKKICNYLHKKGLDIHCIEMINSPDLKDIRPFLWQGWNCSIHYSYYINLQNIIEQNISKDIKQKIRYCKQQYINIKVGGDANNHYKLISKIFFHQNLEPPPKEFFEAVVDLLAKKNIGEMWIAETQSGEIIASRIILWDSKRAYEWSAASAAEFSKIGISAVLLYHVLHSLKERGFKEIDVMQANTLRFSFHITQFNPHLIPNYKIYKKCSTFNAMMKLDTIVQFLSKAIVTKFT